MGVWQPGSKDIHFSLAYSSFGKLEYDNYESEVLNGNSTLARLERKYRELGDEVLENPDFPWESDIAFVTLRADDPVDPPPGSGYGLDMDTLELDAEYDVSKMGAQHGELVLYADCDDVSAAQAAERLKSLEARSPELERRLEGIDRRIRATRRRPSRLRRPRPADIRPRR